MTERIDVLVLRHGRVDFELGATFEIVPVEPSKETQAVVAPYLDTQGYDAGWSDRSSDQRRQISICANEAERIR